METFSALLALCVGIHLSLVNSSHRGQWRWALMFSLVCAWTNRWVNNQNAGNLRRHRAHCDVTVMLRWIAKAPHFYTVPVSSTVWFRYIKVKFLINIHKIHPIVRGRTVWGVFCEIRVWSVLGIAALYEVSDCYGLLYGNQLYIIWILFFVKCCTLIVNWRRDCHIINNSFIWWIIHNRRLYN